MSLGNIFDIEMCCLGICCSPPIIRSLTALTPSTFVNKTRLKDVVFVKFSLDIRLITSKTFCGYRQRQGSNSIDFKVSDHGEKKKTFSVTCAVKDEYDDHQKLEHLYG